MALDETEDLPGWIQEVGTVGAYVILLTVIGMIFWALAVVCEERFVPSLGVICEKCKIPEDVAGATLMAAGASSPEVFASLVALFITHTSLGVGTVVGSEIFNHLMICAGSVAYARGGILTLDRTVVARESAFYMLALVLLIVAVTRERIAVNGEDHIVIRWDDAVVMLCIYASYVLVCANFQAIIGQKKKIQDDPTLQVRKQHVARLVQEPSQNFALDLHEDNSEGTPIHARRVGRSSSERSGSSSEDASSYRATARSASLLPTTTLFRDISEASNVGSSIRHTDSLRRLSHSAARVVHKLQLFGTMHRELDDVDDDVDGYGCYMFRANKFYSMARLSSHAWDLRWCVLRSDLNELHTFKHRIDVGVPYWTKQHGARRYGVKNIHVIDSDRGIFELHLLVKCDDVPVDPNTALKTRTALHVGTLLAPCPHVFDGFVARTRAIIAASAALAAEEAKQPEKKEEPPSPNRGLALLTQWIARTTPPSKKKKPSDDNDRERLLATTTTPVTKPKPPVIDNDDTADLVGDDDGGDEVSLTAWPENGSVLDKAIHVALFPGKAALQLTIRNVRTLDHPTGRDASIAAIQCVLWLAGLSFCMCSACETLGDVMGLSDAVIGITFSAVGTSLPNLFASMTAARQGWGNMAVSNALGSNTFNILVALGFPWLLTTLVSGPYTDLPAEHVVTPVIVLLAVLLGFLALLFTTNFTLRRIHGVAFIILYIIFLYWILSL